MLGSMRAVAQRISYEVCITANILIPMIFTYSFEFQLIRELGMKRVFGGVEAFFLWMICIIAETNRAPFDFVEGESELVAGYHVEVGGGLFALIALAEYGGILAVRVFSMVLYFRGFFTIFFVVGVLRFRMFFVLVRASVPRYRYDALITFC